MRLLELQNEVLSNATPQLILDRPGSEALGWHVESRGA
jgi:hypothetical protein